MLRFAVSLTPVDHPNATDARGNPDMFTSIRSSDIDTLDLDWHVHARIHIGPVFRYVLQHCRVLAFPVGTTIPRRDGLAAPECALGDTIFASLLPPFPLLLQQMPFALQVSRLIIYHPLLLVHPSYRFAVFAEFGRQIVEEDKSDSLGQDDEKDDRSAKLEPSFGGLGGTER